VPRAEAVEVQRPLAEVGINATALRAVRLEQRLGEILVGAVQKPRKVEPRIIDPRVTPVDHPGEVLLTPEDVVRPEVAVHEDELEVRRSGQMAVEHRLRPEPLVAVQEREDGFAAVAEGGL